MKNLFKSAIVIITSVFGLSTNAQTEQTENSMLWEVSGKGLTKPSYLFGTIHMICESDFIMRPKVKEAFDKTTKLALEINMADANEMEYLQKAAMGTELLSKKLSPAQLTELESILQEKGGMSVKQVDNYALTTVMSFLSMKSFGCENLKFYEMELMAKAKENKIDIIGLETAKAQMEFFSQAYTEDQLFGFFKSINGDETKALVQNYVNENVSGVYQNVTDKRFMDAKSKNWLLDVRNTNWAKKMPELMQKESVFFAVGSGHLDGETGVINLLRKAGYTVKPIMN